MNEPNPAFEAWRDSMGREPWAKFDLSAARLGWDAATAALANASAPAEMHELSPFGHEYGEGPKLADLMAAMDAQADVNAPAETEPVAWTTQAMLDDMSDPKTICGTLWPKPAKLATIPLYTHPLPNPSPSDWEVSDEMVFAAMAKADDIGEPLDDIDAREILTSALQACKGRQAVADRPVLVGGLMARGLKTGTKPS